VKQKFVNLTNSGAARRKMKPKVLLGETKWHLQLLLILAH
jgi:hypothetical protein